MSELKYGEEKYLQEALEYIKATYGEHYVGDGDVQTVDFWRSLGSLLTTSRDTAIKYLSRFGKKEGRNRKDLLKTMHYIVLMLHAIDYEENRTKRQTQPVQAPPTQRQINAINEEQSRLDRNYEI